LLYPGWQRKTVVVRSDASSVICRLSLNRVEARQSFKAFQALESSPVVTPSAEDQDTQKVAVKWNGGAAKDHRPNRPGGVGLARNPGKTGEHYCWKLSGYNGWRCPW